MRIFLIGFMGAGKTTIGKNLSAALRYRFVDLDSVIETTAGRSIPTIFDRWGEARFRELEHQCLGRLADLEDVVVATGGGTFAFEVNRDVIRGLGTSVWLDPSFSTIVSRIGETEQRDRPLFRSSEETQALYERRRSSYRLADVHVEVGATETPDEVADRVADLMRERECVI